MLGKVLTALLVMTAVLGCSAHLDFSNMTAEDVQKVQEMMSNTKCNVTTNKAEDAIIATECIKNVTGKEPPIQITEENAHNLTTYLGLNMTKAEQEAVHSCSLKKHGWDKEWSIDEAKIFLEKNMTFTDDATREELGKRIYNCINENKGKEETAACEKEAFLNVCLNKTTADCSPK